MSVLFPKVNKAPTWEWRPIYYDPKKDEMEEKLRKLQSKRAAEEKAAAEKEATEKGAAAEKGVAAEKETASASTGEYTPTLHRGSFREAHEENGSTFGQKARTTSRTAFWLVLLGLLTLLLWIMK